jgi:hypothetical protein
MASGIGIRSTQIGIHISRAKLAGIRCLTVLRTHRRRTLAERCVASLCRDAADVAVVMLANAIAQLSYAKGG